MGIIRIHELAADPSVDMLARIGVLILLFQVGPESTVGQMLQVGLSSFLVAFLGSRPRSRLAGSSGPCCSRARAPTCMRSSARR
ncbi:MAG: hypothetical protein U0166_20805 [Acidobacteriota bacterium]